MSDLGIDIGSMDASGAAFGSGHPLGRVPFTLEGELSAGDLEEMLATPKPGTPAIKNLRNQHHALARLLAEGRNGVECSEITGYSPSRISILQGDPTFADLVQYYRGQVSERYLNVHERLAAIGVTCLEELQERLEVNPNEFTVRELREIMESTFDRSVAPSKGSPKGAGAGLTNGGNTLVVQFVSPKAPQITASGQGEVGALSDSQTLTITAQPA
jgi:hypothetical protein